MCMFAHKNRTPLLSLSCLGNTGCCVSTLVQSNDPTEAQLNSRLLLASNSGSDGHEGAKSAATLNHHLSYILDQLTPCKEQTCVMAAASICICQVSAGVRIVDQYFARKLCFFAPRIPILSAPKPPRMPPEAMPTHMPIMKPILTRSKQEGCPPPCMAPCGTGILL